MGIEETARQVGDKAGRGSLPPKWIQLYYCPVHGGLSEHSKLCGAVLHTDTYCNLPPRAATYQLTEGDTES